MGASVILLCLLAWLAMRGNCDWDINWLLGNMFAPCVRVSNTAEWKSAFWSNPFPSQVNHPDFEHVDMVGDLTRACIPLILLFVSISLFKRLIICRWVGLNCVQCCPCYVLLFIQCMMLPHFLFIIATVENTVPVDTASVREVRMD